MRFQIILPTFNASRWFEESLSSVAGHPDGEVLVIDDGSRDDEREKIESICKKYDGVRFIPQPHRGIAATLNFGLSITTAPYIARMDADDISLPGRFDAQIAALDREPSLGLVAGQFAVIDEHGRHTGKISNFPCDHDNIVSTMLRGAGCIQHPAVMMRREAALAVGGYRRITEFAEDYDLWLRLSEHYRIVNLPIELINYRIHKFQVTQASNWQQTLAAALSCLSAHRRINGERDPLSDIADCQMSDEHYLVPDQEAAAIIYLNTLIKYMNTRSNYNYHREFEKRILANILFYLRNGFPGLSKKHRARLSSILFLNLLNFGDFLTATKAFIVGTKIHPAISLRYISNVLMDMKYHEEHKN